MTWAGATPVPRQATQHLLNIYSTSNSIRAVQPLQKTINYKPEIRKSNSLLTIIPCFF